MVDVDVKLVGYKENSYGGSEYEDANMDVQANYMGIDNERGLELFCLCKREQDDGVKKMNESKHMLALFS